MDDITLRQMQSLSTPATTGPTQPPQRTRIGEAPGEGPAPDFGEVLRERIAGDDRKLPAGAKPAVVGPSLSQPDLPPLKLSAHAQTRIQSRHIPFGPDEQARLQSGVARAEAKGARESLLLLDGAALLVSVKNRTVITAVDAASLKDNVFTNIDSAVIC